MSDRQRPTTDEALGAAGGAGRAAADPAARVASGPRAPTPCPARRGRLPTLLLAALVAAAAFLPGRAAVADRMHDSDDLNYRLRIPESWAWEDKAPFEKEGVKEVAKRELSKLADGKPAEGQGARVMLSVQDVPKELDPEYETWIANWQVILVEIEKATDQGGDVPAELQKKADEARAKIDKALAGLAGVQEVQRLLFERFDSKDPKKWPHPSVDAEGLNLARVVPAASLVVNARAKVVANAPNLQGTPAYCDARMLIWVIRKRFYRLATWAWPTAPRSDRERILDDIDQFEFNGIEIPKTAAIPGKQGAPPPSAGSEEKAEGDSSEEKTITELNLAFRITKPKRLMSVAFDRSTAADRDTGFRFTASTHGGDQVTVDSIVYRIGGGTAAFNIDTWLLGLWSSVVNGHPTGAIGSIPFPTASDKVPFLSLPDMEKKKDLSKEIRRAAPPPKEPKDPKDPKGSGDEGSKADMEKWGIISESKALKLDKEKLRSCWRFAMFAFQDRLGDEQNIEYTFSTSERTYVFRVIARKDGLKLWAPEIAKLLGSFHFLEAPK